MTKRFMRTRALVTACLAVASAMGIGGCGQAEPDAAQTPTSEAPRGIALDYTGFDPENFISDQVLDDSTTMTDAQIAAFIAEKGEGCQAGRANDQDIPCLKDFSVVTESYAGDEYCPWGYQGGEEESAAQIIGQAARSCGVNPQVLLVTLQKEQGLIYASGGDFQWFSYPSAMGYACPDNSTCDPDYAGFQRQVYYAARQFAIYRIKPERYRFQAGQRVEARYAPAQECTTTQITPANRATASMYNYTPYVPNRGALKGRGDDCSVYGNANVYAYMRAWFPQ